MAILRTRTSSFSLGNFYKQYAGLVLHPVLFNQAETVLTLLNYRANK